MVGFWKHYAKTCEVCSSPILQYCFGLLIYEYDWLSKMVASKKEIRSHLEETYGAKDSAMWYYRWQIFHMACTELFAYEGAILGV